MCPIAAPILWHSAATILELAKADANIHTWLASAVELELFTSADETALQMTLFTRKLPLTSFPAFCLAAQKAIPQLTGAGVAILPRKLSPQGRRFENSKPGPQWGNPGLLYNVGDYSYWVGKGGFFQVNRGLVSTLAKLVTASRSGKIAWDLYAGVGLFSRALTESFAQVTGVEPAEPAASGLAAALKSPHRALPMTTLDFLQTAVVQRERPDLIVMDPPRAGIGSEVCALLTRIRAPELVYVSCDPVTLARDLKLLTTSGYAITALHFVDMFPQTFHIESVVVLQR
jgi:23S rRNA (uracil1939-C5)-methyltransferase